MLGFSGAPVTAAEALLLALALPEAAPEAVAVPALVALDPELHAVMPTASPAIASASALRQMREAFIVLLLF